MKVKLITNFSFQTQTEGEYPLPDSVRTIADLLVHIGKQIQFLFIDAARENLRKDIEVVLNGKNIWFYPDGLDTQMKEGDRIDINLTPLGGG